MSFVLCHKVECHLADCCNAEQGYAGCHLCCVVRLSVIWLSVVMLSMVLLGVFYAVSLV